jgi:D-aspartate ligase
MPGWQRDHVQELIPGDEQCGAVYNSYFWNGEPLVEFTSRKIRNSPPETGSPSVVVSEWIPEVAEQGRRLLRAARFSGYSCTEFKRDPRDGQYKVMEVNARHNLSSLLATRCGLNFPWMQYRHLVDGIVPVQRDYQQGIYWVDVTRDLQNATHYLRPARILPGRVHRALPAPARLRRAGSRRRPTGGHPRRRHGPSCGRTGPQEAERPEVVAGRPLQPQVSREG